MRIMLVGQESQRLAPIRQGLAEAGYIIAAELVSTQRLLAQMAIARADLIVIEMIAPDAATLEQIHLVRRRYPCPIVMFTCCAETHMAAAVLKAGVNSYIIDGLEKQRVKPIIDVAIARFNETQSLQSELEQANLNLQERKYIERAKGILMKRIRVEEDAAYQIIRKMAMDRSKRIAEVAETIITAEGLLVQ